MFVAWTKPKAMFQDDVNYVQGDYENFERLWTSYFGTFSFVFLLVADLPRMKETKHTFAKLAWDAGVKQVVDISSSFASFPYRTSLIGHAHHQSEEAMLSIPNRSNLVAIRPSRFMTNHFWYDLYNVKKNHDALLDDQDPDVKGEWISTNDIAAVAAVVLQEPIEKHGDLVYELIGDSVSCKERAALFSKALGRPIEYRHISPQEKYALSMEATHGAHGLVMDFVSVDTTSPPTKCIPILLGRPAETFEQWINANKDFFI